MKGFVLAALFSLAYAAVVLVVFRTSHPERRAALMLWIYLGFLPFLVAAIAVTPVNLGFLPDRLTEPHRWLDGAFGLFTFSASVFGGWLQLYNVADRGLSLRILIDAMEKADHTVTPAYLESAYGRGKGIRWMYGKRLGDLERLRLVHRAADALAVTGPGRRNGVLIMRLRRLYAIGWMTGRRP